jgi:hypothetical protein
MHHAAILDCAYVLEMRLGYILSLTNLEDEISFKGVGFVKTKYLYQRKIMIYINK